MRLLLVNFVVQHTHLFQPLVMLENLSLQDHIQRMRRLTQVELQAAASFFQKELYVFTQSHSSTYYDWIRYKPHLPDKLYVVAPNSCKNIHTSSRAMSCHFECIVNGRNSSLCLSISARVCFTCRVNFVVND